MQAEEKILQHMVVQQQQFEGQSDAQNTEA